MSLPEIKQVYSWNYSEPDILLFFFRQVEFSDWFFLIILLPVSSIFFFCPSSDEAEPQHIYILLIKRIWRYLRESRQKVQWGLSLSTLNPQPLNPLRRTTDGERNAPTIRHWILNNFVRGMSHRCKRHFTSNLYFCNSYKINSILL